MAYKQIDERFWKDQKVKRLSKDGYLFFLYLLTSPHTHFTGMSEMMLDYVNIDTPLTEKESKGAFKELMALGILEYDKANRIVWLKNMYKYQVKSDKQKRGAEIHLNALPKSELCRRLAEILQIHYRYPIDTLSGVEKLQQIPYFEEFKTENTLSIQEEAKAKEEAKENKKQEIVFEIPESLNTPEFLRAWGEWQEHRKQKKSPLTPLAVKKQFNQLEKMGVDRAVLAIDNSILRCWLSINEDQYSPKQKSKGETYPDAMAELTAKYGPPVKY